MKIAIIGTGISGLSIAHYLADDHEITLFEAADRLGGHTATVDVPTEGGSIAVDTGFIVFNDWTYPNFIELMDSLKVESQASNMSFSVSDHKTKLEYSGTSLNTMFAQRRNIYSPTFLKMVKDIVRFNNKAEKHVASMPAQSDLTLGEYLDTHKYCVAFREQYLLPMGAAIWSSSTESMLDFPLRFFVRFFANHGLLNIRNRPQWRVIKGGSRAYIKPLSAKYKNNIRLNSKVQAVSRVVNQAGKAEVILETNGQKERFDHVVFACHSNQALKILNDASNEENAILASIPYKNNDVILHTDTRLLPKNKLCWSSWNVILDDKGGALTYNMNMLQSLKAKETFCITLNQNEHIAPDKIIQSFQYEHPVFTTAGIDAQERWQEINGPSNTWYCGAYWRNGFHEDGVWSAKRVAQALTSHIAQQANNAGASL